MRRFLEGQQLKSIWFPDVGLDLRFLLEEQVKGSLRDSCVDDSNIIELHQFTNDDPLCLNFGDTKLVSALGKCKRIALSSKEVCDLKQMYLLQ